MNIIFLGAPGSGKGTQATKIANDFMLQHISSGDILRDAIMEKTPLGKKVKSHLESGTLVPDRIMSDIISQRLMSLRLIHQKIDRRNGSPRPFHSDESERVHSDESEQAPRSGFILDGFPRTIEQAKELEKITEIDFVVYFKCLFQTIINRLAKRRICPKCAKVYNLMTNPPFHDEICNDCGAKLIQRKDDQELVVRKRVKIYETQIKPLLNFYRKKSILHELDGSLDQNNVYLKIKEVFCLKR